MHIYFKSLMGLAFLFAFGANLYLSSKKELKEFTLLTGKVDYLEKTFKQYPWPHSELGQWNYLKIDSYQKVFEIAKIDSVIGPKNIDKINQLKLSDTIKIYIDENVSHSNPEMGERVIAIEKNDVPYYYCDYNQSNKVGGLSFIAFSLLMLLLLTYLKYTRKIN